MRENTLMQIQKYKSASVNLMKYIKEDDVDKIQEAILEREAVIEYFKENLEELELFKENFDDSMKHLEKDLNKELLNLKDYYKNKMLEVSEGRNAAKGYNSHILNKNIILNRTI
ncbi:hypothetical protein [Clostridium cellulovorans]|uniref:Flagellar protein FliT n=1 Tax=Clostridium cellulovorans (strain ATCC 35296 / DSM 3052 / OCM 3 / 743B) TaxID=573061 RepID=D9SKF7_CLOC7|nr:hypothetical protein [Clostridium cellulovorans]ADL51453.1 hypothetical protein Clocel_1709 [Clostridium cellulovorans 743B]